MDDARSCVIYKNKKLNAVQIIVEISACVNLISKNIAKFRLIFFKNVIDCIDVASPPNDNIKQHSMLFNRMLIFKSETSLQPCVISSNPFNKEPKIVGVVIFNIEFKNSIKIKKIRTKQPTTNIELTAFVTVEER